MKRPRYTLTLEDAGTMPAPLAVRLRTALKRLLRGHGLRTVAIEPQAHNEGTNAMKPVDTDPLGEADNISDIPPRDPAAVAKLIAAGRGKLVKASDVPPPPKPISPPAASAAGKIS